MNSGMPTMLPAVWTTKFRNVFADIVNMCVCMYVVIMYTHTHAFICLQAFAWMQSAAVMQRNKSRWQVFLLLFPRRLLYACLFVVAQDVLLAVCAIRLSARPFHAGLRSCEHKSNTIYSIWMHTHTNSIDCICIHCCFCLNIFIIKIERKLRWELSKHLFNRRRMWYRLNSILWSKCNNNL